MSNNNLYSQLSEQFPQEMERSINKGGANLTYIPISEVINRMNKVLGVENWSFTVTSWQQLGTSIVAHVSVKATINGTVVTRDGVGGQKVKMNKQGDPVDIGDEVKGAVSDALKKAVQTLGVGLYLARSEDAREIEQAIDATSSATSYSVQVKELFDSLDETTKKQVKVFWADYSGGSKKKLSEMSDDELAVINAEIVRIKLGGTMLDAVN